MSKKAYLKEIIPEIIRENGPLSRSDIHKIIINQKKEDIQIKPKSIDENILKLLKEEIITISGYKFDGYKSRMQNIRQDYLVFDVVKTLPFEIKITIKQLESEDPEIIRQAYYELRALFRKKYRATVSFLNKQRPEWEKYLKKISVKDALSEIEDIKLASLTKSQHEYADTIKKSLQPYEPEDNIWIATILNINPSMKEIIKSNGRIIQNNYEILIDKGYSKEDIFSILDLDPGTDLKHVDNIFEKILWEFGINKNSENQDLLSVALSDNYNSIDELRTLLFNLRRLEDSRKDEGIERINEEWWISGTIDILLR